jgi:hypothetical protein
MLARRSGGQVCALIGGALVVAAALTIFASGFVTRAANFSAQEPSDVLRRYLLAMYARDFKTAYESISPRDRAIKPKEFYLQENRSLEGEALAFSRLLASMIIISDSKTRPDGDHAMVSFKAVLPDANAKHVSELTEGFDSAALGRLSAEERKRRMRELALLSRSSRLPTIESPGEEWQLIRVGGRWWVNLNWPSAIRVTFDGESMAGLPWQFEPSRREVRALPGETLQVVYRLKNPTTKTMTAKARHLVTPGEDQRYVEIVTCFCFLEQTLKPGQEVELPVVFRVSYDVPENVEQIDVRYEFYPVNVFPKDATS